MRILCRSIFVSCFVFFFLGNELVYARGDYIDVHIHIDPKAAKQQKMSRRKRKRGQKISQYDTYRDIAANIVSFMNNMDVEKAIVIPPPQVPPFPGRGGTYEQCLLLIENAPERFYLGGGGGILSPLIYKYEAAEVTPLVQLQFRKKAEKLIKAGIVVFGEMSALHLSMHEGHVFSEVAPDHPLFLLLADISAKYDIPINLHMEPVPEDMPTPDSMLNASSNNPDTLKANIEALENLLAHNREAKIVWQHIGWDNLGYMTIELLTDLLNKHPNLYVALRVEYRRLKMDRSGPMENRIVDTNWKVRPEWINFVTKFSDRIVIGSDDFMGMIRQQSRPKDSFVETWSILDQFTEEIAQKIGRDNAVLIYNLD